MTDDAAPVAVVTGGNRGIGCGIARGLATDGYDVAVVYRRDDDAATETAGTVTALGRQCLTLRHSVAEPDECVAAAAQVLERFGRADVLVHAAGAVSSGHDVADTPYEELDRVLRVHVSGAFTLTRELLPALRAAVSPSVVFVSSSVTSTMRAGGAPYNIAKAGLEALARTLANEERARRVRVNTVSPGLVDTELGRRFVRAAHGCSMDELASHLPFGRVATPEDVADVARWLVSSAAGYVTGENIRVNGGGDDVASAGLPDSSEV